MGKPKQPIHPKIDSYAAFVASLSDRLASRVRKNLLAGMPVSEAVNLAYGDLGAEDMITKNIIDLSYQGYLVGSNARVKKTVFEETFLHKVWPKEELTLSANIHQNVEKMKKAVIETTTKQLELGKDWQTVSRQIHGLADVKAELPKYMEQLVEAGEKALSGDPAAIKDMRKKLRAAERQISRLAARGAPTVRLRKAYANLAKNVGSMNQKALKSAVTRAQVSRARYYAERIGRTEIARAYGQGVIDRLNVDEDATGYVSELSSRHPRPDICDFHAEADLYGMGPGVYPKDSGPPYPYHPGCTCILSPYYKAKDANYDEDRGRDYLRKLSDERRKEIMGKRNAAEFLEGKDWRQKLPNYRGIERKLPVLAQEP